MKIKIWFVALFLLLSFAADAAFSDKYLVQRKGSTSYKYKLYTTQAEVGSNRLAVRAGTTTYYAAGTTNTDASFLKFRKGSTTYKVLDSINLFDRTISVSPIYTLTYNYDDNCIYYHTPGTSLYKYNLTTSVNTLLAYIEAFSDLCYYNNHIYVTSISGGNYFVAKYTTSGSFVTSRALSGTAWGICANSSGIFVVTNSNIYKLNESLTIILSGTNTSGPYYAIDVNPIDGRIFIGGASGIYSFSSSLTDRTLVTNSITSIDGLVFNSFGDIYVSKFATTSTYDAKLQKIKSDGTLIKSFWIDGSGVADCCIDRNGTLYVASPSNNTIAVFR